MHAIARKQMVERSRATLARLRCVGASTSVSSEGIEHGSEETDPLLPEGVRLETARSEAPAPQAQWLAERQAIVLSLLAELLDASDLEHALDAFVGGLHTRPGAARVTIGLVADDGGLELGAISQQAVVDAASDEVRLLLEVMEECLEHERTVCFPENDAERANCLGVRSAHRTLAAREARTSLVSVPVYHDAEPVALLLLERHGDEPFERDTCDLLEQIALVSAAPLTLWQEAERSAFGRARQDLHRGLERRFGSERGGARLLLASGVLALVAATLVPISNEVTANAEPVPLERRQVTAPFDGFVESVSVEPGESVLAGQIPARLERSELELEGTRRDGEIASAEAEFRAAMASHDRQATAVARACLDRERASRALVEQRLQRIEVRAPITGLIVGGDLADALGAPVVRGEALFAVAREECFEVHLMVHERDIREVREGQRGVLALNARPGEKLQLEVHAIHPVAESVDGASRFRVRATLDVPEDVTPRPGESGVTRLEAGRRSLLGRFTRMAGQRLTESWWKLAG